MIANHRFFISYLHSELMANEKSVRIQSGLLRLSFVFQHKRHIDFCFLSSAYKNEDKNRDLEKKSAIVSS